MAIIFHLIQKEDWDAAKTSGEVKPESLAEDLIVSFSKPNDLVFDPMAGSGTTLKMALLNNRKYLGMEIHDEYVELIRRRLKHAQNEEQE